MAASFISRYPELQGAGFSGYSYAFRNFTSPVDPTQRIAGVATAMIVQDTTNTTDVAATWDRIVTSHIRATWGDHFTIITDVQAYPSFYAWWDPHVDTAAAGGDGFISSRLLDAESLTTRDPELFKEGLKAMMEPTGLATAYLLSGPGVWQGKGSNAVGPAWRKALAHCTSGVSFPPRNATAKAEAIQALKTMLEPWRKLAPHMGAYLNEVRIYIYIHIYALALSYVESSGGMSVCERVHGTNA